MQQELTYAWVMPFTLSNLGSANSGPLSATSLLFAQELNSFLLEFRLKA